MMKTIVVTNEVILSEWLHRRSRPLLLFNLGDLNPQENLYWEKRLNRLNGDCGCSFGAAGFYMMTFLYPSVLILGGYHQSSRLGLETLVGIVFVFTFLSLGKSFGLLRSRRLLHSSTMSLIDLIRERQKLG
ncbi:MAG: hypothetical protein ABL933_02770 [Methyloglobulus sp.]|nr:hypothetical protein [Methyloglobulus sp.]